MYIIYIYTDVNYLNLKVMALHVFCEPGPETKHYVETLLHKPLEMNVLFYFQYVKFRTNNHNQRKTRVWCIYFHVLNAS